MAKLILGVPVSLDIVDDDVVLESFKKLTFKKLTEKQEKSLKDDTYDLFVESERIASNKKLLEAELEAFQEKKDSANILKTTKSLRVLYKRLNEIDEIFSSDEKLKKLDIILEKRFDKCVGGEDKERLREFADKNGISLADIINELAEDYSRAKGKR